MRLECVMKGDYTLLGGVAVGPSSAAQVSDKETAC